MWLCALLCLEKMQKMADFCGFLTLFCGFLFVLGWVVDFVGRVHYYVCMRLDLALVQRNLYSTRARAVAAIKGGLVMVNGVAAKKPSQDVSESDALVAGALPYSSGRGSLKLESALDFFKINPENMVCLDVGASTGGFTEVLLRRGASRVYAVDVGTNQLIPELRENPRVVSLEQTDIRALPVQSVVDLIVIDVSFVSLTNIIESLCPWGAKNIIALIKPQFEVPRDVAAKYNGVIKSAVLHQESILRVVDAFEKHGFKSVGVTESPVKGGSGNTEFLACFKVG